MTQPVQLSVYVEDPDGAIDDGYTVIRLYRGTTPGGSFSSQVGSDITIVSGTRVYAVSDASGGIGSWYRYLLYGATPGNSDYSPAFRPNAVTLLKIKQEANRQAAGGFVSTCTSTGSTGYLVDSALGDTGRDAHFLEGLWIYRPNAATAADYVRRVAHNGYSNDTNYRLIPSRAWSDTPASAEEYTIFHWVPPIDWPAEPYSWDRAVQDGLRAFQYPDEINLGVGDGVATDFSLDDYGVIRDDMIRNVSLRVFKDTTNFYQLDASLKGRWWELRQNGPQSLRVELHPAPISTQYVIVETLRDFVIPYGDTDTTDCPFDLAVAAAKWALFHHLNAFARPTKYANEEAKAWNDAMAEALKVGALPTPSIA